MKKLALAFVLMAAGPAFGQSVKLPAEVNGEPGAWIVVAPEKVDGGQPKWRIDPGLQEVRLDLLLPPEMLAKLKGKVVTGRPGRYRVEAWNAKGDVASDISTCWVVVGGGGPTPPDPPIPPVPPEPKPPPIPVSKIGIVLVKDSKADDADTLRTLAKAKAYVESRGHVTWVRDVNSTDAQNLGYAAEANAAGLPALIFMSMDGTRRGKAIKLPDTYDAMIKAVIDAGGFADSEIQGDPDAPFVLQGGVKRFLTAKRTPQAKMLAFANYADAWDIIPQAKWRSFTMADLAAPRILDQDGRGACVGHGAAGAFEMAWRFNARQHLEFDPWYLYALINGGSDGGAFVGDSLTAMQKQGVALWGSTPYAEYRLSRVPQKAKDEAKRFKTDIVYQTRSWDAMCSAVQRGHPVVFGIEIGSAFNPDSRGVIPNLRGGGGGHCMFASGVQQISGVWYVHVINSWGTGWGVNGTCFMPKSYFDTQSMMDAYAIVTPAVDPQDPLPLPRLKTASKWRSPEIQFASVP